MTSKQKALIATTLMNTIFQEYATGELNKHGELIWSRVGKFIRVNAKQNKALFLEVVNEADRAWRETIEHFTDKKIMIETKSTIMAIFNYFEADLKQANIKNKHIEEWTKEMIDNAEAEHNSSIVIDYLVERLGMQKRKSIFKTKLTIIKMNRILEENKKCTN